ncbi:MAG: terminase large subunit [Sphingomonadaceae bacterium]|nr:terminase large subunit [Sphingomonadaceae bacterium]
MTVRCDQCRATGRHVCRPRAQRVIDIFSELLVHTKGRWARAPFVLAPWQRRDIVVPLFGTVEFSREWGRWVRRYRTAWIEVARKNGKSELLAGVAIVLLVGDDEQGAEVYGAARDREQARKVFDVAVRMVELSPILSRRLRVYRQTKRIVDDQTGSYYEIVSADAAGNLGHNPHGVIFDEVLTQPSRDLWDAFATAMGAREQPLMLAATTAGDDPVGLCATEHDYTERVLRQPHLDRRRLGYIRNTPKDADPFDPKTWRAANPALGDFKSAQTLRDEANKAKHNPAALKAFKQFHLNMWGTSALTAWLELTVWDQAAGLVRVEEMTGRPAFAGLDLASTTDLAAWCVTTASEPDHAGERTFDAIWRFWAPEARQAGLDERTGGQASVWAREGFLRFTEGDVIDYQAILHDIDVDARRFDLREIGYDRWGMTQLSQQLTDAGLTVIPVGQGFASMSPPTKQWEGLIRSRRYRHGGNPVMRWMIDNVRVQTDPAGNVKIHKGKSADKVDGAIAAVMALDRCLRQPVRKRRAVFV